MIRDPSYAPRAPHPDWNEPDEEEVEMYAFHEPDGSWTLRQTRFKTRRHHPHDVCAVASSYEELKSMCEKHWPEAFSQ